MQRLAPERNGAGLIEERAYLGIHHGRGIEAGRRDHDQIGLFLLDAIENGIEPLSALDVGDAGFFIPNQDVDGGRA